MKEDGGTDAFGEEGLSYFIVGEDQHPPCVDDLEDLFEFLVEHIKQYQYYESISQGEIQNMICIIVSLWGVYQFFMIMMLLQRYKSYYYWGYYYSLWGMLCLPDLCLRQRCQVYCWGLRVQRAMKVMNVTMTIIMMMMQSPISQKFSFLLWRYLANGGSGLLGIVFSCWRMFLAAQRGYLGRGLPFYRLVGRVQVNATYFPSASMIQSLISCFYVFIHAILLSSPSSLETYLSLCQTLFYSQGSSGNYTFYGYFSCSLLAELYKAFTDGQIIVFTMLQSFKIDGGLLIATGLKGISYELAGNRENAMRTIVKALGYIFILALNIINILTICCLIDVYDVIKEQTWEDKSVVEIVLDIVVCLLPTIHASITDQIVLVRGCISCFCAFIDCSLQIWQLFLFPLARLVRLSHGEIVALEDLHLLLHSFHLSGQSMTYFLSWCSYLYDEAYLGRSILLFFLLLLVLDAFRKRGLRVNCWWRFGCMFYLLLDLCIQYLNYSVWQLLIMIVEIYQCWYRKYDFIYYIPDQINSISYQSSFDGRGELRRYPNKDQQPMF